METEHKCELSIKEEAEVWFNELTNDWLMDGNDGDGSPASIYVIYYCPFCGIKLENQDGTSEHQDAATAG